jgi:hypothetical protein
VLLCLDQNSEFDSTEWQADIYPSSAAGSLSLNAAAGLVHSASQASVKSNKTSASKAPSVKSSKSHRSHASLTGRAQGRSVATGPRATVIRQFKLHPGVPRREPHSKSRRSIHKQFASSTRGFSLTLDKRKVVKRHLHHCQGREHSAVRETWCVSESETPPRGGRDAVGRMQRVCVQYLSIFFIRVHLLYVCFIFLPFRPFSRLIKIKYIYFFSLRESSKGDPG